MIDSWSALCAVWVALARGLIAQVVPPLDHVVGALPAAHEFSLLEITGIATAGVGLVTAFGTQVLKPLLDTWSADRRHKREMDALDMANDLAYANEQIRILKEENANLKALAEHNQARLDAIEMHWNEPVLPPSPPPPVPIKSSDEIPIVRVDAPPVPSPLTPPGPAR